MKPMIDLKTQYLEMKDEMLDMLNEVLDSAHYILGAKGAELEKQVREYQAVSEAIGVASGTDALHLALAALGIGPGDEVITTPFTFFATAEAIMYVGAKPVFVDIQPDTYNIDPEEIKKKMTPKTKAIIPVHIFGYPADMDEIMKIASEHKLKIVEDCAQSFGASLNGTKTGSFGDAGCFSFYPSKNLGAYGDGGMVILKDHETAETVRMLRNHGSKGAYKHECVGYNSRLDELQAAILLVKMKRIDTYNAKRRKNAALYTSMLKDAIKCPVEKEGALHVYHQYTIQSSSRDRIQQRLKDAGISSVVYYPIPLHLQKAMEYLGYKEGDLPIAEKAANEVLSLPIYPELAENDIKEACKVILDFLKEGR